MNVPSFSLNVGRWTLDVGRSRASALSPLVCHSAEEKVSTVICRAANQLAPTVTGEMMYMPGGLQEITPIDGGIGKPINVLVDAAGAAALEAQRSALAAKGKRAFFDFNHEDSRASFWPEEFVWRDGPEPGIYARGEWTVSGKSGVEGKEFRQFSPVFHVDNKRGNPARIVCQEKAKPNMGGLVNDPAFHTILPLWAKNAGASSTQPTNPTNPIMTPEEIAALQAKNKELETELQTLRDQQKALKAKNESDALVAAEIRAKEQELKANAAALEVEALKKTNATQGDAIKARNKTDAETAVKAAVERGAIAAKDTKTQEALVARATEDPAFNEVIAAMQGNAALGGRITRSPNAQDPKAVVTAEAPSAIIKAFGAIVAANAALPLTAETYKEKGRLAREAAAIFAKDIDKNADIAGMPMEEAIKAADYSDPAGSVGLLSGTLVLQRALPLLQYKYPILASIATDFSDSPGLWKQTEVTRIIQKPAVQTYDNTLDAGGRPKGWVTVSPAQTIDVPITLDEHVGVPIVFGVQTLAATMRNLFAETAPMALYALGGYFVDKLTALFTAANYNAYKGTTAAAGVTTDGSTAISMTSTANLYPGQEIAGTGIPTPTYIASVTNSTDAVMTRKATASGTGLTFTVGGGKVPTAHATYVKALADFNMASLADIGGAFDINEVAEENRFVLLNAAYYSRLAQDPTFNTFFAAMHSPGVIGKGVLPELQGFMPMKAPWFPSSSNRIGFAGQKTAALIKTRLPQDFTSAVGGGIPGSVTTVTAPGGISVLLVQYVNLQSNYAEWRPEVMLGVAVGDRRVGLVLTSS